LTSRIRRSLIASMGHDRDIEELRRLERLCLEQAKEAATPECRAALHRMAADYRTAAERAARAVGSFNRPGRTIRT
jgi:hypothetical protein